MVHYNKMQLFFYSQDDFILNNLEILSLYTTFKLHDFSLTWLGKYTSVFLYLYILVHSNSRTCKVKNK